MKILCVLAPLFAGLILACLTNHAHASDVSLVDRALAQLHAANGTSSSVLPDITSSGNAYETELPATYTSSHLDGTSESTIPPASTTHLGSSRTTEVTPTLADTTLVPTGTGLPENVTFNLNQAWYGIQLNYPGNPGYNPTQHLGILCENCALNGQLDVKQGGWDVSADKHNPGFLNVTLTNITNTLNFRIQGNETGSMTFPYVSGDEVAPIPVAGIMIPGYGKAGIQVLSEFWIEWNFTAPLTIEYSGHMHMPGEHTASLDFKNMSVSHFGPNTWMGTTGTLLSRSAQVEGGSADFSFGMRTHLKVVFDSVPSGIAAEAGVHFDYPTLWFNTSEAPSVQYEDFCKDSVNHQYPDELTMKNFTDTYPTLIRSYDRMNIAARADLDVAFPWMTNRTLPDNKWAWYGYGPVLKRCYIWDQGQSTMGTVSYTLQHIRDMLNHTTTAGAAGGLDTNNGKTATAMKGAAAATLPSVALSLLKGGLAFAGVVFLTYL